MIHRGFKSQKCQTSLKLALSRIKMTRNKKAAQLNQLKKEVSQLLENNQDQTARVRVEHVIREENFMVTYDCIEVYCQLIVARMQIIETQKNCPIDLKEAISSVIFASQRCDINELSEACKQFQAKYGKDFVVSALELRPNSCVIPLIVEKLSAKAPDIKTKIKVLTSIANDYGIKWEPQSFEEPSQKANEGLLRGSSFESSNKLEGETINHEFISQSEPKQQPVKKSSFDEVTNPVKVSESFSVHDTVTTTRQSLSKPKTPEWRNEGLTSSQPFNGEEINYGIQSGFTMDFKDATSAAQAAAELAEMAARASAELAFQENFSRVLPFPSHTKSELSSESTETHNKFSPHSNLHNQSPSKYTNSSAYLNFEGKEDKSVWSQTRHAKGSVESNRMSNVGSDLIKKCRRTNYSLIPNSSEVEKGKSVTSQAYKLSLPKYSDETNRASTVMGSDLSMIHVHQSTFPHQSRSKSKNFSSSSESITFEFCKVCKLNNNQGRKHKYFPMHTKKVTSLLSRFRQKLSDAKFFLKNPSLLHPNLTERGRLWCVFCELDLSDVGSTFVCENVIYHLASVEHMKSLKSFLSKNGGGTDCTDAFRLTEFDVLKWEKKCKELRNSVQSSSGGFAASLHVFSMKDIQTQFTSNCTDSLENNRIDHFTPIISYDVTPLQNHTNERCLPSYLEVARVGDVASESHVGGSSSLRRSINGGLTVQDMSFGQTAMGRLAVEQGNQLRFLGSGHMAVHDLSNESDHSTFKEKESTSDIFFLEACQGNALSSNMHRPFEGNANKKILCGNSVLLPSQPRTSQKLNPKRIGAAWAEKRRAELEQEKREGIAIIYDPNWLPNFGGVWQTGTRKESKKEFEIEKIKRIKTGKQFEAPILKPYVSKRMRLCTNVSENSIDGHGD